MDIKCEPEEHESHQIGQNYNEVLLSPFNGPHSRIKQDNGLDANCRYETTTSNDTLKTFGTINVKTKEELRIAPNTDRAYIKKEPPEYEISVTETVLHDDKSRIGSLLKSTVAVPTVKLCNMTFFKRNFVCGICYEIFSSSAEEKLHKKATHSGKVGNNSYTCEKCFFVCETLSLLKEHKSKHSRKCNNRTDIDLDDSVEKSFKCSICSYVGKRSFDLRRHNMIHSRQKPFKCDECDYSCVSQYYLNSHLVTHFGEKSFKCDECSYAGKRQKDLKLHKKSHSGEKPYTCDKCDYSSVMLSNVKMHKVTHSNEKPFKCDHCDYASKRPYELKAHRLIHTFEKSIKDNDSEKSDNVCRHVNIYKLNTYGDTIFKCSDCKYSTNFPYKTKVHTNDSAVNPYKCGQCSYITFKRSNMEAHHETHSGEKPFKCDECDYVTKRLRYIKIHKLTHSTEKPFKCDECDYSSLQHRLLAVHKMTHSGEKPFTCDKCSFACRRMCSLKIHKMTHTGVKRYKCEDCDYQSNSQYKVKEHKMIHSGEKPFKCAHCSYSTKRLFDLNKHKMKHSGENLNDSSSANILCSNSSGDQTEHTSKACTKQKNDLNPLRTLDVTFEDTSKMVTSDTSNLKVNEELRTEAETDDLYVKNEPREYEVPIISGEM